MAAIDEFLTARDFLLRHREDRAAALRGFRWPHVEHFNWALDHFDAMARGNDRPALWIVDEANNTVSLRPVEVLSFETGAALVSGGIEEGETYVADGTKLLRPGQTVAASEGAAQ